MKQTNAHVIDKNIYFILFERFFQADQTIYISQ